MKVVQRISVIIRVDPDPGSPNLRAGMSAVVDIDTGHERKLSDLWDSGSKPVTTQEASHDATKG